MPSPDDATTLSLDRYAPDAKALVAGAQALADERQHPEVQPLHLLSRAIEHDLGVREVFRRAVSNVVEFEAALGRALAGLPRSVEPAYLSSAMLDLLERAEREAERSRAGRVETEHLLNALSQEIRGPAGEVLGAYGIAPGSLRPHVSLLKSMPRKERRPENGSPLLYTRDLLASYQSAETDPVIGRVDEVRRLLTILERRQKSHPLLVGEAGVGKGAIIRALAQKLSRGDVPTRLLDVRLLELDTGALVAGARLRGEIEERIRKLLEALKASGTESVLVAPDLEQLFGQGPTGAAVGDLLKPALERGEVRLLGTTLPEGLRRIQERDPAVLRLFTVLMVDEPNVEFATEIVRGVAARYEAHHAVSISEDAVAAAVRLAKRYVQDRFLPDTAIDLLDESAAAKRVETDGMPREVDSAVSRMHSLEAQLKTLQDAEDAQSRSMYLELETELRALEPKVQEMRSRLEARREAVAAVRALGAELEEARRKLEQAKVEKNYARMGELEHGVVPDLERRYAEAEAKARSAGVQVSPRVLRAEDVAGTLAGWTGIPVAKMLEGEADKLLKMEARLAQRVVGQHDAVSAIARAVRRGRVGLRDPGKPIGSFLFLGPSGVGKTELAKALAQFLFDDEQALTRLDMSEFMERHMAQRLIGAPPGYADSERGGFLTEAVRRRPYSVLLFDEVEKAHQDVFNLLLQVLDDGRLTDGRGRLADFSNTVVIMTSNIGSERILGTDAALFDSEEGREALRDVLLENLRDFFRPEFLNRINDVVVFRPLSKTHLRQIVDIQIGELQAMLADRHLTLRLDDAVKSRLVEQGYEPALGARPLQRAILKAIQDPLAEALLAGGYEAGTTLRVRLDDERLVFEPV